MYTREGRSGGLQTDDFAARTVGERMRSRARQRANRGALALSKAPMLGMRRWRTCSYLLSLSSSLISFPLTTGLGLHDSLSS